MFLRLVFACLVLSGCSPYMAATQPTQKALTILETNTHRDLIIAEFGAPVNLLPPINSPGDDIYISFNREQTHGYFSSSRRGGYGDMDIYEFYEMDKPAWSYCRNKSVE